MNTMITARIREVGLTALAFMLAATLSFGLGLLLPSPAAQAYAADGTELKAAQVGTESSDHTLNTAVVKKKYLGKQKMSMTMAGGDITYIGTTKMGSKVKWSSSKKKIVKVKSTGKYTAKVTALKPGKATITAKSDGQTLTCTVVVTGALNKTKLTLTPFDSGKLKLKGAKAKKWKTSNKNVVKVSKGSVTPVGTGEATITCTDKKGYKYTCAVNVKCPAITCTMSAIGSLPYDGATYYIRSFSMTNKSKKSLTLNSDDIKYYPDGIDASSHYLAAFDRTSVQLLSKKPISVAANQNCSFWGLGATYADVKSTGLFSVRFNVGSRAYLGVFYTGGTMAACWRV